MGCLTLQAGILLGAAGRSETAALKTRLDAGTLLVPLLIVILEVWVALIPSGRCRVAGFDCWRVVVVGGRCDTAGASSTQSLGQTLLPCKTTVLPHRSLVLALAARHGRPTGWGAIEESTGTQSHTL